LEREINCFNQLEGGVCTTCAPRDQRKSSNSEHEQVGLVSAAGPYFASGVILFGEPRICARSAAEVQHEPIFDRPLLALAQLPFQLTIALASVVMPEPAFTQNAQDAVAGDVDVELAGESAPLVLTGKDLGKGMARRGRQCGDSYAAGDPKSDSVFLISPSIYWFAFNQATATSTIGL
jgi:hypothetical protein